MKFLDLFAGIGGFRLGMEQAGHTCVGYVEWDKFARLSYQAIHNTEGELTAHDITTVRASDIPRANIWCFGFPCQDISVAGKQKGFTGNRSSLFFTVTRLIRDLEEENRPEFLLIENVKNLLSINGGWDFAKLQIELDEIGYDCEWDVLNSKEVVPQNRERVFIVGHLRGRRTRKVFPIERENGSASETNEIVRLFNGRRDGSYGSQDVLSPNGISTTLNTMSGGGREPKIAVMGNVNPSGKGINGNVYSSEGISPTINTNKGEGAKIAIREATKKGYSEAQVGDSVNISQPNSKTRRGRVGKQRANTLETGLNQGVVVPVITPDRMNKRQNGRRFKENGDPAFTLNTQDRHGIYDGLRIRKLTPRECWRLQGFPDWAFDKAQEVNSNSQLYKQAGNSVTVPVIYEIAKRFKFS